MQLTNENYYSVEANKHYMSVSQLKNFIGTPFLKGCEKRALAEINGEYEREKTTSLLVGSYVDTALTGTKADMDKFIADNPQIISSKGATKGQLKSDYKQADVMIDRVKRDKFFMRTLEGQHQVIMTGEIFGVPFKIKIDNLADKAIVDLKTCESLTKIYYAEGRRINFIEYHNYILQGAIYQEIARQNIGKTLPFFLSCVSKEKVPDLGVFQIDNETLAECLASLEDDIKYVQMLKNGEVEPRECGCCDYCKEHKILTKPINWLDLGDETNND